MPDRMSLIEASFPEFRGNESTAEKVAAIQRYLFLQKEALDYLLRNLDEDNFSTAWLANLEQKFGATRETGNKEALYANDIYYDNAQSGLGASNVQKAIDVVEGQIPSAYTSTPEMDGTAFAGSSGSFARGDHVHPSDTSRVPATRTVNGKALSSDISLDKTDVGLGNVANVLQYSASNPPPSDASKQDKITAAGILKGNGSGGVSAAVAGTDYQTPLTAGTDYQTPLTAGTDYQTPLTAGTDYQTPLTAGTDYQTPLIAGTDYATPAMIPSEPSPSNATPQDLGTAAAGSSSDYSRADHVHNKPTYSKTDVGLGNVANVLQYSAGNKPTAGDVTYSGSTVAAELAGLAAQDSAILTEQEILAQIADGVYDGVDLTVKHAEEIAASPYSGDPWAWIRARIRAGNYSGIHVGDWIPFTTTEAEPQSFQAQIMGIDLYRGYGDTGHVVGHHIDWCCKELWNEQKAINPKNYNNGYPAFTPSGGTEQPAVEHPWLACDLYHWLNSLSGYVPNATTKTPAMLAVNYTSGGVYYFLPAALKAVITEKRLYAPKRYNASNLQNSDTGGSYTDVGRLWAPAEWEVYGGAAWGGLNKYAVTGMQYQYPLFKLARSRVKYSGSDKVNWWLLSTYDGATTYWCCAGTSGIANTLAASSTTAGAPVCFRIEE